MPENPVLYNPPTKNPLARSQAVIPDSEVTHGRLGPALAALNLRQRKFVSALLDTGGTNYKRCAMMAGYVGNDDTMAVTGHRLAHDSKVLAAIEEESKRRVRASVSMATSQLVTIAESTPLVKDKLKAIEMILNRGGMHALTESRTTVEHTTDQLGMVERITQLATKLGMDPKALLGQHLPASAPSEPEPIDVEFEEVEPSEQGLEDLL